MRSAPSGRLLYALRDRAFTHVGAISELIDNALDQGSRRIRFGWPKDNEFFIEDDGAGLPARVAAWEQLFAIGEHIPNEAQRRRSGQFGIGFKNATAWLWGEMDIESCDGQRTGRLAMRWESWARERDWELPDPQFHVTPGAPTGFSLNCSHILRRTPDRQARDTLIRELSFLFNPALRRGARIECQYRREAPIIFSAFEAPPRTDVISLSLVVEGKSLSLNIGLVPAEHPNPRNGLHYYRAHRLVKAGSTLGCGRTNPGRIFGWVELSREWILSPDKDEITDPLRDHLAIAIEDAARPVLEKAGHEAEHLAIHDLEAELSARLTSRMIAVRRPSPQLPLPKPKPQSDSQRQGGRHRQAARKQPGNGLIEAVKRGGVRVVIVDLADEQGIGLVQSDIGIVIKINRTHPEVDRVLMRAHDQLGGIHQLAVTLLAFAIATATEVTPLGQLQIRYRGESEAFTFSRALGELLSILRDDG